MKKTCIWLAAIASAALAFAEADDEGLSGDSISWNRGVDLYREGRNDEAMRLLRPLLQSKTHSSRAAGLAAKIEYDAAMAMDETNRLEKLESSAGAARDALHSSPDDPRLRANFLRASQDIASLRENRHLARVLSAADGKKASELAGKAVGESRTILEEAGKLPSFRAAERIERADALAAKAEKVSDVWLQLKDKVAGAGGEGADPDAVAALLERFDSARAQSAAAAKALADIEPGAVGELEQSESALTDAWRLALAGEGDLHRLMSESAISQTNAMHDAAQIGSRDWQGDALQWTSAFRSALKSGEAQHQPTAQNDPEKLKKIAEEAEKLEKLQYEALKSRDKAKQQEALDSASAILKLLEEDQQQEQQQKQDQLQQQDQQQNQQKQQQDHQRQDQQQQEQDEDRQDSEDDEKSGEEQDSAEKKEELKQDEEKEQDESGEQEQAEEEEDASENGEDAAGKEETQSPEERQKAADDALILKVLSRSEDHDTEKKRRRRGSAEEIGW
ncbi:MAG: hypothetical protein K6F50_05940 [Kiritimatiellae bacterium]|nr:hypothetical protein [Kiritimatiellia bacterium]